MPRVTDPETLEAIRRDYAAGATNLSKLAEKHGVSFGTAKKAVQSKPNGKPEARLGVVTLAVTAAVLDTVWQSLTLEQKATLLSKLAEVH